MFRDMLIATLQTAYPLARIDAVESCPEIWSTATQHETVDLFMVDLLFPGMRGEASVAHIRSEFPRAAIVILTMLEDHRLAERMLRSGANGFLGKALSASEMLESLERIRGGAAVVNIARPSNGAAKLAIVDAPHLTPRQLDMLQQLQTHKQNKAIARVLGLSPHTVRNHIADLMRALGAHKRSMILPRAVELGLLDPSALERGDEG